MTIMHCSVPMCARERMIESDKERDRRREGGRERMYLCTSKCVCMC